MARSSISGRTAAAITTLALATFGFGGFASGATIGPSRPTMTTAPQRALAIRLPESIAVGVRGDLTPPVISTLRSIIERAHVKSTVVHQGTLDLTELRRPKGSTSTTIAAAPIGASVPISTTAIDPAAAAEIYGKDVGATLAKRGGVLGTTSAKLRGAKVGDEIDVDDWAGPPLSASIRIGAIVPDERAAGSELLISTETAALVHLDRPARVMAWAMPAAQRDRLAASLEAVVGKPFVRRSWIPPTPDAVLTQAGIKELLGEFAIRRAGTALSVDAAWLRSHVARAPVPIIGPITCNKALLGPMSAALHEIELAGLAPLIDVADTRRAGGCFNGREVHTLTGVNGRNLSRHSWGAAVDINPSQNRFGAVPKMDARIVDAFRRQGFAWGGTWAVPDGMHFEYVGTPRVVGAPLPTVPSTTTTIASSTTTTHPASTSSSTSSSTTSTKLSSSTTTTRPSRTTSSTTATSTTTTHSATSTAPSSTTPTTSSTTTTLVQPPIVGDGDLGGF